METDVENKSVLTKGAEGRDEFGGGIDMYTLSYRV